MRSPWVTDAELGVDAAEEVDNKSIDNTERHGVAKEFVGSVGGGWPFDSLSEAMGARHFSEGEMASAGAKPVASLETSCYGRENGPGYGLGNPRVRQIFVEYPVLSRANVMGEGL